MSGAVEAHATPAGRGSWRQLRLWARAGGALGLSVAVAAACTSSKPEPDEPECPIPGPAFRLQLSAEDGALPGDTIVTFAYGGSQEEVFRVAAANGTNQDVCCRLGHRQSSPYPATDCDSSQSKKRAPDASSGFDVVLCDVWSNGAAQVSARAQGYAVLDADLAATLDEECMQVETQQIDLVLRRPDAGASP